MMGRLKSEQVQLFYQFNLEDAVPDDHLVRRIDAALDLSWLRDELAQKDRDAVRPLEAYSEAWSASLARTSRCPR
jgi:hypothetical protein